MSLLRRPLNAWLRKVEKRRMQTGDVQTLRRALEQQSRLFFHLPRGTQRSWQTFGGVPCLTMTPRNASPHRYLFYIHGGGFVFGSPDTHKALAARIAAQIGAQVIMPRYRLAPEHPFPAAPDDVRCAWDGLIASGVSASDIVVGGDSAGGALTFGLTSTLCAEGAELPGAVFGFSPLTDLTYCGPSFASNAIADVILAAERAAELAEMFLCKHPANEPRVSPLFGECKGAPPAWLTVGDTEILLDDSLRLAAKFKADGVEVELVVEHDLPHVWPIFHNVLPEARSTITALAHWIRRQQNWEV